MLSDILAIGLATYGISRTVTNESGAFGLFDKLRNYFEDKKPIAPIAPQNGNDMAWDNYTLALDVYDDDINNFELSLNGLGYGLSHCPYCLSVWVSLFLSLIYFGFNVKTIISSGGAIGITAILLGLENYGNSEN